MTNSVSKITCRECGRIEYVDTTQQDFDRLIQRVIETGECTGHCPCGSVADIRHHRDIQ